MNSKIGMGRDFTNYIEKVLWGWYFIGMKKKIWYDRWKSFCHGRRYCLWNLPNRKNPPGPIPPEGFLSAIIYSF